MDERPWFRHYDAGVPQHLDYPKVPLFHFMEEAARKYPDRPCTIFKGAVITYAQMNALTDRLAAGLAELGVKKGDPVAVFMPNVPQFVITFFGILKAGGVVVANNPLYTPREIEHQLKDSGAEIMLVTSNFYSKTKEVQARTRLRKLVVTNIKEGLPPVLRLLFTVAKEKKDGHRVTLAEGDVWFQDLIARHTPADRPKLAIGPDDTAIFQYSGGTTGLSKAAVSTHFNLVVNTLQIYAWMPATVEGQETLLMAIPLFHVYGMVAGMLYAIRAAASMVMIPNPRDLKDLLENIDKYHPTVFPGGPDAVQRHQQSSGGPGWEARPAVNQGVHFRIGAAHARDEGTLRSSDGREAGRGVWAVRSAHGHALQPAQRRDPHGIHRSAVSGCRLQDRLAR